VSEDAPIEEPSVVKAEEEIVPDETAVPVLDSIESAIAANSHVYVVTAGTTDVISSTGGCYRRSNYPQPSRMDGFPQNSRPPVQVSLMNSS
jgi:hypothetical protein